MDSLVIYRDYTFLYSPSLMYPLRVWLMMCALCMREGGMVLIFPSPTAAADTDTGWSRRYWLVTGDCLRLLDCLGVFLIFSTRVYFSYSPGCISQISKVDRGCSWRYWLVTGCRWVLCASDSCFLAAASIQCCTMCTSPLWATFVVHAHCLSLPQGCTWLHLGSA